MNTIQNNKLSTRAFYPSANWIYPLILAIFLSFAIHGNATSLREDKPNAGANAWAGPANKAWYISSPRIACLGDSVLASSFISYHPESVYGDGSTLTVNLPSTDHIIKKGSEIRLIGLNPEICSKIYTVDSVRGKYIQIKSTFMGTAKKQFNCTPACATFTVKYGYVSHALTYFKGASPLFTPALSASAVGSISRDAVARMDYELVPLADRFDAVLIQLGTNDMRSEKVPFEEYINNMDRIIRKVHGMGKMAIIGNLPPTLASAKDADRYASRIRAANSALAELGKLHGVAVLDFYAQMVDANGFAKKDYMNDERHPSRKGYMEMGKVLYTHAQKYFGPIKPYLTQ